MERIGLVMVVCLGLAALWLGVPILPVLQHPQRALKAMVDAWNPPDPPPPDLPKSDAAEYSGPSSGSPQPDVSSSPPPSAEKRPPTSQADCRPYSGPPSASPPVNARLQEVLDRRLKPLENELLQAGFCPGAPVYLRIFKLEAELELWIQDGTHYRLFHTYPICTFSGTLGPKLQEGDKQAPEGIYAVGVSQLNPDSRFHLSFDLGYPNLYERSLGRTGSDLMVHGNCLSIGCYAMTDPQIESIYLLVHLSLKQRGGTLPVHAFPFRMTPDRLQHYADNPWFDFWKGLSRIYQRFELTRQLPEVSVTPTGYQLKRGS